MSSPALCPPIMYTLVREPRREARVKYLEAQKEGTSTILSRKEGLWHVLHHALGSPATHAAFPHLALGVQLAHQLKAYCG